MRYIILGLIFMFSLSIHAQQSKIDSLKLKLNENKNDEFEKLNLLKELAEIIHLNGIHKKYFTYLKELQVLSKKQKNDSLIVKSNIYISEYFLLEEKKEKAENIIREIIKKQDSLNFPNNQYLLLNQLARIIHYQDGFLHAEKIYKKAISKYERNPTGEIIFYLYSNLSETYRQLGDNKLSEESSLKAIEYAEKLNKKNLMIDVYSQLGWQLMDSKEYEKADKYFKYKLELNKKYESENDGYIYRELALNCSRWGKYQLAINYNKKALKYLTEIDDKRYIMDVLNSIAVTYNRMRDGKNGIIYGKKTLKAALDLKHPFAIRIAKHTLAVAYKENKDYSKSLTLFNETAKDTIGDDERLDIKISLLSNLSDIYYAQKKHKQALTMFKRSKTLQDTLDFKEKERKILEFETKYQTEKKEKENLKLKADKAEQALNLERESKQKWYFAIGLIASLLVLGIFFYFYKKQKEQKKIIEDLQKELHHRVKNNLTIIDSLIEEIKDDIDSKQLNDKLAELQNRINSINEVHRQLYISTDITKLNVKKYISKLAQNIEQSFSEKEIEIKQNIDDAIHLDVEQSFPVGLIINEFITNSFKHGFDSNQKGIIEIGISENQKNYQLHLKDNGKGLPENFDISKLQSFGMDIMKLLSKQLKGSFALKNNNGVQIDIEFPKV